jgi:DNA-binding winged helix-turn-helix (wHTH) protein/tetratricopeptide (TPR) repeat protein
MPIAADRHNAQRLDLGPWRIDLERGTVIADGEQGKLLPRAESLLLLLCRYANQVVGREQILDNVWAGRVVEDAAISHCVWQIRKALGDQGKDILQTLPKRGYLLTVADDAWLIEDQAAMQALDNDSLSPEAFRSQPPRDAASPIADAAAPLSHSSRRHPRVWRIAAIGIAVAMVILIGFLAWQTQRAVPARIVLQPDIEMTAAVIAPDALNWVREPVLRTAVESAYLRGGAVLAFERPQRSNPFAGPHLQVEVAPSAVREVVAELSLRHGSNVVREHFRGPGSALAGAVRKFLERSLAPTVKTPTRAEDALISALTANLLFDYQRALVEFRRALARDPASAAVIIPMAVSLYDQGQGREALSLIERVRPDAALDPAQRCELQSLLVQLAPEKNKQPLCVRAGRLSRFKRLEMRELMRDIDAEQGQPRGAGQWNFDEIMLVRAQIRLGEIAEAQDRIVQAQRIAAEAGWESARLNFQAQRTAIAMSQGREAQGVKIGMDTADAMEALGNVRKAIDVRTFVLRFVQVAPGAVTAERREMLQTLADRARAAGTVRGEIATLHLLTALERDRPDASRSHLQRIRELIDTAYTPAMGVQDTQIVLNEIRYGLRYRETLDGVAALDRAGATSAQAQLWNLTLRVEAHFARDELQAAVAAVDAMERENFELKEAHPCLITWLLAEAGRVDRALLLLKLCQATPYDRISQASRGDFGLLGKARLHQKGCEPDRAWPMLRPRIDTLLATSELSREEAESLALLSRYATSMPGADRERLQRALGIVERIAARDGAGPTLRTGVHLLRWRLCATDGRSDCGPVLPPWAPEELFEQRMAREAAGG